MPVMNKVVLSQMELKTLRRIFNALGGVPFVRTKKPTLDFGAIETRLRSAAKSDETTFEFSTNEIEMTMCGIEAVLAEYPDEPALKLYLGSSCGEIVSVKGKLDVLMHVPA